MSLATVTSPSSITHRDMPRPAVPRRRVATLMAALQRRWHVAAQRTDERQPQTDAYLDRYGTVELDATSLAAFFQR